MEQKKRIAVGLSGGVDSSVAAAILKEAGSTVVGITMKIWSESLGIKIKEEGKHACFGPGEEEDIEACRRLCAKLGIEYQVLDLTQEYESHVIEYFRREYRAGRTPNPCIVCNRELKFGFLVNGAKKLGIEFDYFATGHYARIENRGGVNFLKRAACESKDQSYFLYGLDSERLSHVIFPLGGLSKDEVREKARELGLEVADKPDSQDFIAGGDYSPLFADRPPEPGDFVDMEGRVLGRHRGLPYYTIGQRRGLGISVGPEPLYVMRLEPETNRVVLGPNAGLFAEKIELSELRLQDPRMEAAMRGTGPDSVPSDAAAGAAATLGTTAGRGPGLAAFGKIRQNHRPAACTLSREDGVALVEFETPQRAAAPGQSLVLYSGDGLVLGGGIIEGVRQ